MNIGLMIIELEEEQLGDNQVGTAVIDHSLQKDDPVFKEPAIDVENTFFAAASLDHVGNQRHGEFLQAVPVPERSRQPGFGVIREKGKRHPDGRLAKAEKMARPASSCLLPFS